MRHALSASGPHLTGGLLHIGTSSPDRTLLKESTLIRKRHHARPGIPSLALISTTSSNYPLSAQAQGLKAQTE